MCLQFAGNGKAGFEHLLVEGPFLEAEELRTLLPTELFALKELIERRTGGIGAKVVKGRGTRFPPVPRRELAQAMHGASQRGGGRPQGTAFFQLEPGRKELVLPGRFIGLAGPQVQRSVGAG